jgi:hypothetical protein
MDVAVEVPLVKVPLELAAVGEPLESECGEPTEVEAPTAEGVLVNELNYTLPSMYNKEIHYQKYGTLRCEKGMGVWEKRLHLAYAISLLNP